MKEHPNAKTIPHLGTQQQAGMICWAACISALFGSYRIEISQADLIAVVRQRTQGVPIPTNPGISQNFLADAAVPMNMDVALSIASEHLTEIVRQRERQQVSINHTPMLLSQFMTEFLSPLPTRDFSRNPVPIVEYNNVGIPIGHVVLFLGGERTQNGFHIECWDPALGKRSMPLTEATVWEVQIRRS